MYQKLSSWSFEFISNATLKPSAVPYFLILNTVIGQNDTGSNLSRCSSFNTADISKNGSLPDLYFSALSNSSLNAVKLSLQHEHTSSSHITMVYIIRNFKSFSQRQGSELGRINLWTYMHHDTN